MGCGAGVGSVLAEGVNMEKLLMDKEQIKARLAEIRNEIEQRQAEVRELDQQLANLSAEFKVGDRITYEGAKAVWEIRDIRPGIWADFAYHGSKLKKDGTPGALVSHILKPYNKPFILASS